MPRQKNIKKIGLIGPFGYGNLGDAAIQEAMIQHIQLCIPDAEIVGFSLNPEDTEARHGIKSYPISRMSWKETEKGNRSARGLGRLRQKFGSSSNPKLRNLERWIARVPIELGLWLNAYRNLEDIDALIVSGGGQLDDYWGGGGPWSHPYTLLKWGLLTKLRRGKFIFISVGAGPIDARLSQLFIKYALSVADYRSFRDQYSRNLIETIGFQNNDPVYPDLAHSLIVTQRCRIDRQPRKLPVVGIGPIGYFKRECWPEHDQAIYSEYLAKMTAFVSWLLEEQYGVVFLPGETHYDQLAIYDLQKALKNSGIRYRDEQLIETQISSLDDLLHQLSGIDFVVGSRFHTVLLAQLFEKPVLAISYQAKIDSLMADNGQAEYCLSIKNFEPDQLIHLFTSLVNNSQAITYQLSLRIRDYRNALEQQYERIFAEIR